MSDEESIIEKHGLEKPIREALATGGDFEWIEVSDGRVECPHCGREMNSTPSETWVHESRCPGRPDGGAADE